jgi:hypothetical protein
LGAPAVEAARRILTQRSASQLPASGAPFKYPKKPQIWSPNKKDGQSSWKIGQSGIVSLN